MSASSSFLLIAALPLFSISIFCCTHLCLPPSFIYTPLVHPFPPFLNRIFSIRTCVAALPEHSCSCTHLFYVRTILLTYYLLGKSIVYMYLCSAPPLPVPTLYPWPFGLIIFLICTSFVPNLLGLLLNPASPSLNILSISFSAWLLLLPAH